MSDNVGPCVVENKRNPSPFVVHGASFFAMLWCGLMIRFVLIPALGLVASALLPASSATGQCRLCEPGQTKPVESDAKEQPLRIDIQSSLDFSRMTTAGQGGDARIDPVSGTRSVTGGLVALGGMPFRGTAKVTGSPRRSIRVDLPNRITLRSSTGGIAEIYDIATDLPPAPTLGADGSLSFSFGGRLSVKGQVSGTFRGQVPVTAEYQ
jgi:hypothetical protein